MKHDTNRQKLGNGRVGVPRRPDNRSAAFLPANQDFQIPGKPAKHIGS
jgi:hypothetical protein